MDQAKKLIEHIKTYKEKKKHNEQLTYWDNYNYTQDIISLSHIYKEIKDLENEIEIILKDEKEMKK